VNPLLRWTTFAALAIPAVVLLKYRLGK